MKLTPKDLIESWNTLTEVQTANPEPQLQGQINRLQMQLRNEVLFWNELDQEGRNAIGDEPMTVQFDKITVIPELYSNDQRAALQRFFEPEVPKKQPAMASLIENETQTKTEEE